MRNKIIGTIVLSITVLFFEMLFVVFKPYFAEAATLSAFCPSCGAIYSEAYETTDTVYTNSNESGHQRRTRYVFLCNKGHGWTEYIYFSEPHYTPNNNPCPCGFVPHNK